MHSEALIYILTLESVVFGFGLFVWLWSEYLDRHWYSYEQIRGLMFPIIIVIIVLELVICHSIMQRWVIGMVMLCDLWGSVDAILRYPSVYDFNSFFSLKQVVLLIAKTCSYAFGITNFNLPIAICLILVLLFTWLLPMMYLVALPFDEEDQLVKSDARDVDLLVHLWRLAVSSSKRRQCLAICAKWWRRKLIAASEFSQLGYCLICIASPDFRRVYRKNCRRV